MSRSIGIYVQKAPFYQKTNKIKNIYKDIVHLFCLKRFFFKRGFLYINTKRTEHKAKYFGFFTFYSRLREENSV